MKKLVCILLCILFLSGCSRVNVEDMLIDKAEEFKNYGKNYSMEDAKEDGFYVEDTISAAAPEEIIRFIEAIWQEDDADVMIARVEGDSLILSYLINYDNVVHVLDYNTQDGTYQTKEYNYLTYNYDVNKNTQSRYLTNDKNLEGKDELNEEQKSNCYYLCSYQTAEEDE